ncbi:MAG TPA: AraC family transcriptional regulator [Burkholderiaceae bacterium]|nr:AraC family transcriptional regulator [Burkholderiaceae bacterium]
MTHHTIAVHHVVQVLQGTERRGVASAALLQRAGISAALLEAPLARVSQEQYARLLRVVQHALRDEFWGLCSQPLRLGSFAQCCRLLIHTPTLADALRVGFRYFHGELPDFVARLGVDDGAATVRIATPLPAEPSLLYAERTFLFFTFGLASWLVARRIPLSAVGYRGPAPPNVAETARAFQAKVRHGQPHFSLSFDARWLQLPMVQNAQSLREFLQQAPANLLVKYRDKASVTERIRRLLRSHLRGEMPSLDEVGRVLGMTPQTLRRRLREEGQGFQSLKDNLRRDAAIEYLARPELTLLDIADQTGFSEASTFHRAFKKWTGVAPGEYRQRHR